MVVVFDALITQFIDTRQPFLLARVLVRVKLGLDTRRSLSPRRLEE